MFDGLFANSLEADRLPVGVSDKVSSVRVLIMDGEGVMDLRESKGDTGGVEDERL